MRVQSVEITNFKNIKDLKQDFVQGVYLFTGDNERGKSSLIDAIMLCLTGQNIPSESITRGQEKGAIKITVGDDNKVYTIERKFTQANPNGYLEICTEDGMKTDKVGMLQQLFNYTDFSADEFIKWSESAEGRRKQLEIVKGFLSPEEREVILKLDLQKVDLLTKRKEVNAQIKVYEGMVKGDTYNEEYRRKYAEPENVEGLNAEFQAATKINSDRDNVVSRMQERAKEILDVPLREEKELSSLTDQILDWEKQIITLKEKIEGANAERLKLLEENEVKMKDLVEKQKQAEEWLKANPAIDTEEISQKIANSAEHNQNVAKLAEYMKKEQKLAELEADYTYKTGVLKEVMDRREEIVKTAKVPVPGLSFNDEGLTLNDLPFESTQIATSQKIEVAAKLMIAKNPKVKVFKVLNGESLGIERLKSIIEFAEKNGYQGFIEEVKRGQEKLKIELVEKFEEGNYISKDVTKEVAKETETTQTAE
jgi:recombinational DNA repair ATPase RecF